MLQQLNVPFWAEVLWCYCQLRRGRLEKRLHFCCDVALWSRIALCYCWPAVSVLFPNGISWRFFEVNPKQKACRIQWRDSGYEVFGWGRTISCRCYKRWAGKLLKIPIHLKSFPCACGMLHAELRRWCVTVWLGDTSNLTKLEFDASRLCQ